MPTKLTTSSIPSQYREVLAPQSLGYRLRLTTLLLSRRFQEMLDPHDLTVFHWVVLCCLWQEDGLATSAIGDKLQQVGGTLTGVLDRMEERGLVRRQRDTQDRRVCRIWLTEAGVRLREVLPPLAIDLRELAFAGMSEQERQQLSALVDRMIANLA